MRAIHNETPQDNSPLEGPGAEREEAPESPGESKTKRGPKNLLPKTRNTKWKTHKDGTNEDE